MATLPEALAIAAEHYRAGRLPFAETICRQILAVAPNQPDTLHLLGIVSAQLGNRDVGVECLKRALAGRPNWAEAHHNLGLTLREQGKLDEAAAAYRRAVQLKPDFADAHSSLGVVAHALGNLDEAIACYRRALHLKPNAVAPTINLGNALRERGNLDEAAFFLQRALQLNPDEAAAYNGLAAVFKSLGRLEESAAYCRRALELAPHFFDAAYNLANALKEQGKLDEAAAGYLRALQLNPDFAEAYNNLGVVYYHLSDAMGQAGKLEDAAACFRRTVQLQPDHAEAHNNLGIICKRQGNLEEAAACHRRALQWKPNYAEAHDNLGSVLRSQGNWEEAAASHRRALEANPNLFKAVFNLGNIAHARGDLHEAAALFERALQLRPDDAAVLNNLGNVKHALGQWDAAAACFRRVLEVHPDFFEALFNLGNVAHALERRDEAAACYARALQLRPDYAGVRSNLVHQLQQMCQWDDVADHCRRVIESVDDGVPSASADPLSPFSFLALPTATTARQQLRCAQRWANEQWKRANASGQALAFARPAKRSSKITVGYLSADFRVHATAALIVELFEKHDRNRFEIIGYSYGRDDGSAMRQRLVEAFDQFVDVKDASFMEAARRIAADGVDILVDLKGYTGETRTEILALRPAPLQVNYLGYPGTMGASFMDYILVDDFVVPADQQPFFAETLVHLPGCYQVNDSQRAIAAQTPSRSECGLPETGFVFCSFNNNYKITADVFGVWMRLLKEVPGSVLWLLEGNRFAPANLRREAEARGIAPERLVFAPRRPGPEHLARHRLADLFLDTFPVTAHTTASDALWAGCPLVTIAGETFVSRVAASILRAIGLPELIATSLDDYQALALRLARDSNLLGDLRARSAQNRATSPLFNAERFARNLEQAYRTMWDRYAAGDKPCSF